MSNTQSGAQFPYDVRVWDLREDLSEGGTLAQRSLDWQQAIMFGFHKAKPSDEMVAHKVHYYAADNPRYYGVYYRDTGSETGAQERLTLGNNVPVATFASFSKLFNAGRSELEAHLITGVTVRASHRRRGILSVLMERDLQYAHEKNRPLAALTASEATIYGRYGFGPANRIRRISVDTSTGFALLGERNRGRVEFLALSRAGEAQARLARAVLALQFGALARPEYYSPLVSGQWERPEPGKPDSHMRAAGYFNPAGELEGYVSFKYDRASEPGASAGSSEGGSTIDIEDMLTLTPHAYQSLWHFLGSLDLIDRVRWATAPLEDPLPWLLEDRRRYTVQGEEDHLWLRPLDVPTLLEARTYERDAVVELTIDDRLGYAAGRFALAVRGGVGRVHRRDTASEGPRVRVDVADFGSLYLGDVSVRVLAEAGRLEGNGEGLAECQALFGRAGHPISLVDF